MLSIEDYRRLLSQEHSIAHLLALSSVEDLEPPLALDPAIGAGPGGRSVLIFLFDTKLCWC